MSGVDRRAMWRAGAVGALALQSVVLTASHSFIEVPSTGDGLDLANRDAPRRVRNIVTSVLVCGSVCLSVCKLT